jgi:cell division protein FtsQ
VQQFAPPSGRALAGLPLEMEDPDGDDSPRPGALRSDWQDGDSSRKGVPGRRGWRPSSNAGRVFLMLAAVSVLGGLATSAYLLKTYVDRDERFRISGASNIVATGLTEVSRAEMLPVFGEDIGRNVFFVPLNERRRQLEEIPWIEKATVMRLLPNQIRISVVERQPVAFTRQGQQIGLVDANGILLTMPPAMMAQRHYSFPVITGIDAGDPPASRKARMAVYQRLLTSLDSGGQKLSTQISEVDLTDPEDARVTLQDDTTLLHFGDEQFLARYQRYKAHIAEWRQQYPLLAAVDLRYDQQVVLEMISGANVAPVSAGEQAAANATEQKQPVLRTADSPQIAGKSPQKRQPAAKVPVHQTTASPSRNLQRQVHASGVESRPAAKAKPGKSGAKPAAHSSAKAKAAAKKDRDARAKAVKARTKEKKRAEARRAALNLSMRKTAPTSRSAVSAGMGE